MNKFWFTLRLVFVYAGLLVNSSGQAQNKQGSTSGALELTTKIPELEFGMMDHAYVFGWSSDGKEFGYCAHDGMDEVSDCDFVTPSGAHEQVNVDESSPAKERKSLEKHLKEKAYSVPKTSWGYASDLVVAWETSRDSETKPLRVKVGAVLRKQKEVDYSIDMSFSKDSFYTVHIETIALSPDGKYLAVLAHAYGGEGVNAFSVEIKSVGFLASRAYNKAGLVSHKAKDYKASQVLFQKSIEADESYAWAYYNLGCAKALSKAPESEIEEVLRKAFELGGDKLKKKAKSDKDFDSVRTASWFLLLLE
jgi:hypothetical protein